MPSVAARVRLDHGAAAERRARRGRPHDEQVALRQRHLVRRAEAGPRRPRPARSAAGPAATPWPSSRRRRCGTSAACCGSAASARRPATRSLTSTRRVASQRARRGDDLAALQVVRCRRPPGSPRPASRWAPAPPSGGATGARAPWPARRPAGSRPPGPPKLAVEQRAGHHGAESGDGEDPVDRQARAAGGGRARSCWSRRSSMAARSSRPARVTAETGTIGAPASTVPAHGLLDLGLTSSSHSSSTRSTLVTHDDAARIASRSRMARCSRVCGITPSSAATTSSAMSIPPTPASMFLMKRSWPGTSTKLTSWPLGSVEPGEAEVDRHAPLLLLGEPVGSMPVSAWTSVDLPWSTWPAVPTTRIGSDAPSAVAARLGDRVVGGQSTRAQVEQTSGSSLGRDRSTVRRAAATPPTPRPQSRSDGVERPRATATARRQRLAGQRAAADRRLPSPTVQPSAPRPARDQRSRRASSSSTGRRDHPPERDGALGLATQVVQQRRAAAPPASACPAAARGSAGAAAAADQLGRADQDAGLRPAQQLVAAEAVTRSAPAATLCLHRRLAGQPEPRRYRAASRSRGRRPAAGRAHGPSVGELGQRRRVRRSRSTR